MLVDSFLVILLNENLYESNFQGIPSQQLFTHSRVEQNLTKYEIEEILIHLRGLFFQISLRGCNTLLDIFLAAFCLKNIFAAYRYPLVKTEKRKLQYECMSLERNAYLYCIVHCPKFLKFSRDMLRSVDATKLNGAELLGLFSRITFWTVLLFFVNELHNILRNSLWFCSVI